MRGDEADLIKSSLKAFHLKDDWCKYCLFCMFGDPLESKFIHRYHFIRMGMTKNLDRNLRYLIDNDVILKDTSLKYDTTYLPKYEVFFILGYLDRSIIPEKRRGNSMEGRFKECARSLITSYRTKKPLRIRKDAMFSSDEVLLSFLEPSSKKYGGMEVITLQKIAKRVRDIYAQRLVRWVCFNPILHLAYVEKYGPLALTELTYRGIPGSEYVSGERSLSNGLFHFLVEFKRGKHSRDRLRNDFKRYFTQHLSGHSSMDYSIPINYPRDQAVIPGKILEAYEQQLDKILEQATDEEFYDFFSGVWELRNLDIYTSILFARRTLERGLRSSPIQRSILRELGGRG